MCGIAGIVALTDNGKSGFGRMANAVQTLKHRGPDADGIFLHDHVCLGHARLSIIDLSELGSQPMTDATGRYTIVFNGEFYNYREKRKLLEDRGFSFRSDSDTEVLLGLYAAFGTEMFQHINGFFAFAIYDRESGETLVARDRMGIKPLYYSLDKDRVLFASELKTMNRLGIEKELDPMSLRFYFQLGYIPAPYSIFRGTKKLLPGHFLRVKNGDVSIEKYYSIPVPDSANQRGDDYETAKRKVFDLVHDAVKLRMISDVPLGAFLSGGIDSSVIVAAASSFTDKLHTFSIGFKDQPYFDETEYALAVAKKFNTEHTVFSLSNDDLFENLYRVLDYTDEPFADSSALAVNILSMHTKKSVSVALSGDGGDEMFAGYRKHRAEFRIRNSGWKEALVKDMGPLWKRLPKSRSSAWGNRFRQFERFSEGAKLAPGERYWLWATLATQPEIDSMLGQPVSADEWDMARRQWLGIFNSGGSINQVLYADMQLVLPNDMLYKVDMMSMDHGLEVRVPLLDYRLVDYVFSLPQNFKIDENRQKKLLVDSFSRILPMQILNRPKKGFEVPMAHWLRSDLSPLMDDLFSADRMAHQGILNPSIIDTLRQQLVSADPGDVHFRLWSLIVFQYWWKKFMEGN